MVTEGYPAATFAAGTAQVRSVDGASRDWKSATNTVPPIGPGLRSLFDNSDGRALVVFHKGRRVLEYYAPGYDAETRFNSFSLVKSLVGALALRSIDAGRFELSTRLSDLKNSTLTLASKGQRSAGAVSVEELLTMRSGLHYAAFGGLFLQSMNSPKDKDFERTLFNPFGPMALLHFGDLTRVQNGLVAIRTQNKAARFNYQNVNTAILGRVVADSWQRPLHHLLSEQIWKPAGAATAKWRAYPGNGTVTPYCCLFATARDWARVGNFILQNGTKSRPFLKSATWQSYIRPALPRHVIENGAYGLHIRHDVLNRQGESLQGRFAYMMGQGGQVVYIMPSNNLVVVRFGGRHQKLHSTLYEVWRQVQSLNKVD